MKRHGNRFLPAFLWLLVVLVLWELISWYITEIAETQLAQSKLPYVHKVLSTLVTYSGTLVQEGIVTFGNAGLGFLLGASFGVLLAVIMSISKWAERIAFPYLIISQMIPVLGLAPIIYGIIHDQNLSRIVIAGYITFFPVSLNTLSGLRSTSQQSLELMHSYAAKSYQTYWKLKLPSALPNLFSGLKIAAPLSVTAAILVELMGTKHGIGVVILRNLYYGPSHTYMFWASVVASALLGIAGYGLVSLIERLCTPWQPAFQRKGDDHQ
ncbi:NitT/TauT family transport system permease protein [Fontibacillus panacisegetis]|uniref:NitT/TauT family transport system permease protein n=1 Tax=Fontibacillus panacisegetis TaxID=670482 RepID=A0A1G7U8M8_9BACL|nr:ABC transporter permease [Fontibacillus panacisegetis]SDG43120.1 NitT/TauT family transport system permease protein [Fontibacillus panacisegetis]